MSEHKPDLTSKRIGRVLTKVYCPICKDIKLATQETVLETLTLECKHTRDLLLPPKTNSVGIEEIYLNTSSANKHFPKTNIVEYGQGENKRHYWED
jgi:signal recognition particle subunit SEC65